MTREEKQKAIDALKISSPIRAMTNKEFNDYIQTLNKVMDWLEQEPTTQSFEWCDTCKEYDQEKHCCHRWTKVIRNTVEEMKQAYIEREVLDKIRAEIEQQEKWLMIAGYNAYNVDIAFNAIKSEVAKYKAETEVEDGNDD